MKNTIIIFYLLFATIQAFADIKWIPIEPIKTEQTTKQDSNFSSQLQPMNNMLDNLKIIQHLLDKKNDAEEDLDEESDKNWYNLKNTVNN
ncbi:MAG: hypothetical protein NTZ60_08280 [Campylobacterales bacterium]|nr:hypothetical protein [Campylobacterales bacterium]